LPFCCAARDRVDVARRARVATILSPFAAAVAGLVGSTLAVDTAFSHFRRAAQLHTMSDGKATVASTTEEILRRHVKCFSE
jgi:hypothetical protein